jgi:translation initiation factor 2 subunit 1
VGTVTDYGAYANLDEYGKRGLLHISEISSRRMRNIRDFVRENQKLVLKVLRVDPEKGHVDLSLRRVTKREHIEKIKFWKKERKADALLRGVAEKLGLSVEEVYQSAGVLLDEKFGLYEGFERLVKDGPEVLTKLGVAENVADVFAQVAQERIKVKFYEVRGTIEVKCNTPNGVKCIQDAFNAAKAQKPRDSRIHFAVIAAPKYSVEVEADSWKRAENVLEQAGQTVVCTVTQAGGEGKFRREK